jgi:hypothetical protein
MRKPSFRSHSDFSDAVDEEDLAGLIEAAEELGQQLDVEPGLFVRSLTQVLRRQSEFSRLRDRFDVRLINT